MHLRAIARTTARSGALLFCLLALLISRAALPVAHADTSVAQPSLDAGSDLVGYWPFDLGSAEVDRSGSGNTVTFGDGMGLTSPAAPLPFDNPTALLSGPSPTSYATAPGNHLNDLQQFTLSFWVRMRSLPLNNTTMTLVALTNKTYVQYAAVSGKPYFEFEVQNSTFGRSIYAQNVPLNTYVHVVATYDGNGMNLYANGQRMNSLPGFFPPRVGAGVAFSSPTAPLDGSLDDVRIYNRGLSQGEVARMDFQCGAAGEIPQAECQALVDLYKGAGGSQWTNQTNWLLSATPCTWYGVLCANGHVLALSLSNNGLRGPLPPTLGNLSALVVLSLYANQLSGGIPPELGALSNLQTLDLFNNQLSGGIPPELGALGKLQTLRLANNQLRGTIPAQLAGLSGLITLDLGFNGLYATDGALTQFLSALQPSWAATQTVPPSNIQARVRSGSSADLIWATIPYTADGGFYEVFTAPQPGGAYTSAGKTASKAATGLTLSGLTAGTTYAVVVRAFTPKHGAQQNDLTSEDSAGLAVTPAAAAPATITIVLDVQPNSATNFTFSGSLGSFTLDDSAPQDSDAFTNTKTFSVPAGTYTVTEQPVGGYLDANISCNPTDGAIADLARHQIAINAASGASITCTFVAQRAGQIIAGKYSDHNRNHRRDKDDEWLNGWEMQLHSPFTSLVVPQMTAGEGRTTFTNLFPGIYTICEQQQPGWQNITPNVLNATYNAPCYTVVVKPGQAVWTRFGNSTVAAGVAGANLAAAAPIEDIVVCDLPPTDDAGTMTGPERDPWEEEEDAGRSTIFLPLIVH